MANTVLISQMANRASYFVQGELWCRILYCDDLNGFFQCTDDEGFEYQISYEEVDLTTDKFYKSVEMDPEEYRDLQDVPG